MRITLFGATGFVGKKLLELALQENHEITVLARSPDKLGALKSQVNCIEGDYFDPQAVRNALQGADAVLSCIGPPLGFGRKQFIGKYPQAMTSLINELNSAGITRVITIAGASVPLPGSELPLLAKITRVMMLLIGGQISRDKDEEALLLANSGLDWTILRPPGIKAGTMGNFVASETVLRSPFVNLEQLCQFMIANLSDETWVRKAPLTSTK